MGTRGRVRRSRVPLNDDDDVDSSDAGSDREDEKLISSVLAIDADENGKKARKDLQARRMYAAKRAELPTEIFHYINTAQCRRLFALAWYDDLTDADHDGSRKPLPMSCCNGPGSLSPEPGFMQRESFIAVSVVKYTESD